MEINSYSHYKTDNKCYNKLNSVDTNFMDKNFEKKYYQIADNPDGSYLKDCKNEAIRQNKSVFFVNDLSINNLGKYGYNCYLPSGDFLCNTGKTSDLFKPFNDLINGLLGIDTARLSTDITTKIDFNNNPTNVVPDCFYTEKNNKRDFFSGNSNKFVMYKTELIDDNELITNLDDLQSYEVYESFFNNWKNNNETILENVKQSMENYICDNSTQNEKLFLGSLVRDTMRPNDNPGYYDHLTEIIQTNDELARDISNLSIITKYDILYLEQIQRRIDNKKKDLNNLLGFDGANNGKLSDTKTLKNFKVAENIILILVAILAIFFYAKNSNKKKIGEVEKVEKVEKVEELEQTKK